MVIDGIDRNALAIRDKVLGVIDDYGNIDGDIYPIYVGRTRVVIPSWVRVLYDGAFSQSYDIQEVILPEGLIKIGFRSFAERYHLKAIKLPDSLEEIDSYAFTHCTGLTLVELPDKYFTISRSMQNKHDNYLIEAERYYKGKHPSGELKLDEFSFSGCFKLKHSFLSQFFTNTQSYRDIVRNYNELTKGG